MLDIHWTGLPLHRSSPRTREYLLLLGQVDTLLHSDQSPDGHTDLFDLLDRLSSFLNTPLLAGDTFALEAELLHLMCLPPSSSGTTGLAATTRAHLHLLRYRADASGPGALEGWATSLRGASLGLAVQPVGFLGAYELILLTRDGQQLRETRLAPIGGQQLALAHAVQVESPPLTALGANVAGTPDPLQIEVRRASGPDSSSSHELRVRRHPAEPWRVVHSARHPLQHPLFDGETLYFTARSSQLMALPAPLSPTSRPVEIITLDTPSPIQGLVRYPSPEGFTLLAATADGTLFAIDPLNRRLRWKFDSGHSIATLALSDDAERALLAIGTPDGLLELFHPVETSGLRDLISSLIERANLSLQELLDQIADPEAAARFPHLRLTVIDRLIESDQRDPRYLESIRQGLHQAFEQAQRGGRISPSSIMRFITYLCYKLAGQHSSRPGARGGLKQSREPFLATLLGVLEQLAPQSHGDARRRLERLLRRLRDDWLGPELYEHYRSQHAPTLTLQSLSTYSLRHDAAAQVRRAEALNDPSGKIDHLLQALSATWRRFLTPLNRATSLQGIMHAVRVYAGPAEHHGIENEAWLVGLSREGLHIFRVDPALGSPQALAFYPLTGGVRIASGPLLEAHADVVAVSRGDQIVLLRFDLSDGTPTLRSLPVPDLQLDEPVTALEILELPTRASDLPFVPALAVGQADGRIRLFRIVAAGDIDPMVRYRWKTLLDLHRPSPVHHVGIYSWPEWPALIIGADPQLHIYHEVQLEADQLDGKLEVLELDCPATAFTVAWPPPRLVSGPRPILIVGLANGLVQAFQPPPPTGQSPELCWIYRAPQVITDLAYLPDPSGGWFIAAADDGELHLLRYGEPHHKVMVERYPFDVTPIQLPWALRPHLLVSSPAGAVNLLEITGTTAAQETSELLELLEALVPDGDLATLMIQRDDPALLALAIQLMRSRPLEALVSFVEQCRVRMLVDAPLAQTLLQTLLARAGEDPRARELAYDFLQVALGGSDVPLWVKVHLLQSLGEHLDRVEEGEIDLLLSPLNLDEPMVARAYLEMLEHLWARFRSTLQDDLIWWRGVHRLGVGSDQFDRRHLQPAIGMFARKLLDLSRENVLEQVRHVRDLEERGLYLARLVCEALALPHVIGDSVTRQVVAQYARLLKAQGPAQLQDELRARRDLLEQYADVLPGARTARQVYEDILETFDYNDYDQYSRFLVDAPEFMPQARMSRTENSTVLEAFTEVRTKLTAAIPPPVTEKDRVTQYQDRVQTLVAQSDVLLDFVRRWSTGATLEQQTVAAILVRWRDRILQPEIRRLQEAVELSVRDVRVMLPEDGGLAEVTSRIHNLGGRPLEGLMVGLVPGPKDAWLWEGTAEWCPGPLSYGKSIEYRTELLLEEDVDEVALTFEIRYLEGGQETRRLVPHTARVQREEGMAAAPGIGRFQEEMPATFDAIRQTLTRSDPGRIVLLITEEVREREQLLLDLASTLSDGIDPSKRVTIVLDLPGMLEGPARASAEELPAWWLPDRLARALHERGQLDTLPERVELRADPRAALDRALSQALEGIQELWLVLRRATRAFAAHPARTIEQARDWLRIVLEHPAHRIRVLMAGDFALAARTGLSSSSLAARVDLIDVDRPYPFESPRSRAEMLKRIQGLLNAAHVFPSELVRNKLLAQAGWNLPLLRRLIARLEQRRSEAWLQWQRKSKDQLGEPEELEPFLRTSLDAISRPLKERLRVLPFFHRLALAAIASGRIQLARRELREGMVLARDVWTTVRQRGNRPKRLYAAHAVLLEGDVAYLTVTVGELQGGLEVGLFRTPDYGFSLSHLLAVVGLPRLLSDLQTLGLVRHQSQHGGSSWTVTSPLLRRWLVSAHPFEAGEEANLRRRLTEESNVAELVPLPALVEINGRLSSTGQLTDFLIFMGLLEEEQRKGSPQLESAFRRWERLLGLARRTVAWRSRPSAESFRALIQEWAGLFGCRVEALEGELDEGAFGVNIDLTPLRIPRLRRAAVFGLTREPNPMRIERLSEAMRRATTSLDLDSGELPSGVMGFTLLPIAPPGGDSQISLQPPDLDEYRELLGDRLVPLTERDFVGGVLAEDSRRAFLDLLARGGFRFQHLSPYHLLGPLKGRAMDVLFVGRADEIDDVLRHPDQQFAIVGSRKIGKTSLLLKLKQELSLHLGEKARVLYIDCATLTPPQTWRAITDGLNLAPVPAEDARLGVRRQLEALKYPVVLLLDEIDGLYDGGPQAEEAGERFMWDLRSLTAAGVLRLIMAGYVRIYERRLDPKSAFHNFTTFRKLGALTTEAARTLIRGPMSSLDIEMASEGLVDLILDRTYRVPWIMQLFCHQLIMRLDDRLERSHRFDRRILREDVDGVSVQIEEELYTHFTSARVMSVAEQVLLLTMVEAGALSFSERDLRERLETRFGEDVWIPIKYEDLPRALDNLTLTLALTVEGGVYSFPLDMYPTVVRSRLGDVRPRLERLYQKLVREA